MILTTEQNKVLNDWKHEPVVLVVAPAGTGKSLLAQNIAMDAINEGYSIHCVGFGRKDTKNFKEKLLELGVKTSDAKVGTVHSRCYWIMMLAAQKKLQDYDRFLDGRDLRVYSGARRSKLMQEAIGKVVENPTPLTFKDIPQKIELIKAIGVLPKENMGYGVGSDDPDVAWSVYAEYQRLLNRDNAMDFGDYMIYAKRILIQDAEIRERATPDLLIVDEAHDLSIAQWEVVRLLTYNPLSLHSDTFPPEKGDRGLRIRVFGDPCQQLYEFRGALGKALPEKMKDYFGEYKEQLLTQNFRSAPEIIAHSEAIIPRGVVATLSCKGIVEVINDPYTNSMEHAKYVADKIASLIQESKDKGEAGSGGLEYKDIAVLCSVTHLMPPIELQLNKLAIPYQKGQANWYSRPEVRELVAWTRMANPTKLGETPFVKRYDKGFMKQHPFLDVYNAPPIKLMDEEGSEILSPKGEVRYLNDSWLRHHFWTKNGRETTVEARLNPIKYPPQFRRAIRTLYGNIQEVQKKKSPYEVIQWVLNSMHPEYRPFHEARSMEDTDAYAFIQTLLDIAAECTNGDFLEKLVEMENNKDSVDAVELSTIHGSKGREWKAIFVVLCPLSFADAEQELAKHYVSTTRAKEVLFESVAGWLGLGVSKYDFLTDDKKIDYTRSTMTWYNQYKEAVEYV